MTVLEMNACGRPVIAFGKRGALETIIDGSTGFLFGEQSVASLVTRSCGSSSSRSIAR
jgi:glycosyltransferase involved in cell wall biosynthesis